MRLLATIWPERYLPVCLCMVISILYGLAGLIVSTANAGTVSGQIITGEADYRFSGCIRPSAPVASVDGPASYNEAVRQYNQYVEDINVYMACITDEANTDLDTQISLITNAHQDEVDSVKQESAQSKAYLQSLGLTGSPIGEVPTIERPASETPDLQQDDGIEN